MNKLFLLLGFCFPLFACGQTAQPIFSISNGLISTNSQFVDSFELNYWNAYSVGPLGTPIQVGVGSQSYTIKTGFLINSNQDGDFEAIEVSRNGQQVFLLKNGDGIVKFDNSKFMPPNYFFSNRFVSFAANDYFIEVPLSADSKALIFMGIPYGTDLPRLIIFVLTPSDVTLVYYQDMDVESMVKTSSSFSMVVQSNLLSDDGGTPITHSIFLQNGVLKFVDL